MPNYKNSNNSFYKDAKTSAYGLYKNALEKDKAEVRSEITEVGSGIGGIFGSVGQAIGGLIGLGAGYLYTGVADPDKIYKKTNRNAAYLKLLDARNSAYLSAEESMENRSEILGSLKRIGNQMRVEFNANYGAGTFESVQGAIRDILNLSNNDTIYNTLSSLNEDTVVGEVATRLLYNNSDIFDKNAVYTNEDYRNMLESYVSLGDLGSEYSKYIVEKAMLGGLSKSQASDITKQLEYSNMTLYQQLLETESEYSGMFRNAFLSMASDNISSETSIANTESKQNGFKRKGTSTSGKIQKYKSDLQKVAYLTTLEQYKNSLKLALDSMSLSRDKAYYTYQKEIMNLQNSIEVSINNSMNEYLYGVASGIGKYSKESENEAMAMSQTLAYNEIMKTTEKEIGMPEDERASRIYTVESLTY